MDAPEFERTRYRKDVVTLDDDHPWHLIRAHVPAGARVLDVGCGSGDLGRFISVTAAAVDGIELNPDRADEARQSLRTVVTGAAGPDTSAMLPGDYDVVVFADVLEHIPDTATALRWATTLLAPGGRILALIPNSANWKFRRKIMQGDWSYHDSGYFDRDHVRFFDVRTARALGAEAGLREESFECVPGELPKPLRSWTTGAARMTELRPNLFAGHVLIQWSPRESPRHRAARRMR